MRDSYDHLLLEIQGGVARLTLNRPQRLNALDPALTAELDDFFGTLGQRHDVRVVVLRGAGRAFCAGLDLDALKAGGVQRGVEGMYALQRSVSHVVQQMRRCPQPIVAIVQGSASGGGMALALGADIRLMTPDARMNAAFIRIGLSGCDVGVTYFLTRMVGASVAAELLLTGRFLPAARALALGLVSQVGDLPALEQEAEALVADMLRSSALGLRLTKDTLGLAIDAPSLDAAIALDDRTQLMCTQTPEFAEGVAAFLEKRAPRFGPQEPQA